MYRFKPNYPLHARPLSDYPAQSQQAAALMLMIQNNLDPAVAQHPEELITYGGNGAVFQNWAQYTLCMHYLAQMTDEQTLHLYSGHPYGALPFVQERTPSCRYQRHDDSQLFENPMIGKNSTRLGVTQYGQMTAGSFMYIGPQGIVHGTTITLLNAFRKILQPHENSGGKIFLTAGLGVE